VPISARPSWRVIRKRARLAPDMMVTVDRTVALVVCDDEGTVLGQLEPFTVGTPWWQDVGPVHCCYPDLTVLRLLDGVPARGATVGGHVRYLAQDCSGTRAWTSLSKCDVVVADHPLRMPWARPGGPRADLAWASSFVERTGRADQDRTWNLSAIWSMPTDQGRAWLKCVPPFFGHEGALLGLLAGPGVPRLIAGAGHRILLEDMGGRDGHDASVEETLPLVDALVGLQCRTAPRVDDLLAAGVPDARWPALLPELAALVARRASHDIRLVRLVGTAEDRAKAIDECGFPDGLVHGDAHPGNARLGTKPVVWFDWGDSRVGNPLLDLAVLDEGDPERRELVEQYWLAAWARAVPGCEPWRAWKLLRPLAALRTALVYQTFLDNIEPSERPYHAGDVGPALELAAALAKPEAY
jgi:Phosphotransferase enzyme family